MNNHSIPTSPQMKAVMRWIIRILLVVLVLTILMSPFFNQMVFIETSIHLVLGWLFHTIKVIPSLAGKWSALLLPAGCLLVAVVLIHRFAGRLLATKQPTRHLRPRDTAAVTSLVLLSCAAAIALSGVLHESIWLSDAPWTERHGRSESSNAMSNARQLVMGLYEFHQEKGHYPESLRELEAEPYNMANCVWLKSQSWGVPEPFLLLHPGDTQAAAVDEPLIVSPVLWKENKIVVGYGDMSAKAMPAGRLKDILSHRVKSELPTSNGP